jgi:uncharacterized Tic20 family protein
LIKPPVNLENITLYLQYQLGGVEMSKSANNVLASFCYFSVFFMPFLFPLIVWILASGNTARHARKALLYHILPIIFIIVSAVILSTISNDYNNITFIVGIIIGLLAIYYMIKNLFLGIKLLLA